MSDKFRALLMEFLCWFSVGLAAFLLTFTFDDEIPLYRYGANVWPAIISLCLMLCITILFVYSSVSKKFLQDADNSTTPLTIFTIFGTFSIPVFYVLLIPYIGFYVGTIIFIPVYSYIMSKASIIKIILVSVPASFIIIVIFTKFLFVPFPVGTINAFYVINSEIVNLLY
ncbi:tripartite tricarboxylate transporter TctB family protein [uncultured Desulfovibrio sp.]|uniref:tripartite tricarboxylate transporter TctB family protein n=1 Tax=uncultured Desulfovibrio sp. TaxID=167968 RepID=UPI0025EF9847|nr:tripartite tricarboxylate transporter TctB family protein [uncultured Desulfovibrio sp.]